jgi:dTDP-glucose pyrophosphorylase
MELSEKGRVDETDRRRGYPLTRTVPKHLLPVAGRPVLDYVVERLGAIGIDQACW